MSTKQGLKIAIKETIKQGCRSVGEDGYCAYRGVDGVKCPIGHLIPDGKFTPDIEWFAAVKVFNIGVIPQKYLTDNKYQAYFAALLFCHDSVDDDNFVKSFCDGIKRKVGLKELPKYCLDFLPDEFKD